MFAMIASENVPCLEDSTPFDRWIQSIQKITATGGSKLLTIGGRLAYSGSQHVVSEAPSPSSSRA